VLQRVFDLAAIHGGFVPRTVRGQFEGSISETAKALQLPEDAAAEAEADATDDEADEEEAEVYRAVGGEDDVAPADWGSVQISIGSLRIPAESSQVADGTGGR